MAAPAFGAIGTRLAGATSGTAAVPVPAGVTAGQIVYVFLYLEADRAITAPSGFALLGGANQATGNHWTYVYWKRATASDSGTYSFTFTSTFREGVALRVTDAIATGDPNDVFAKAGRSTSGTVTPAVSVTTTGVDRLLIWFGSDFSTGSWTPPSGYTERLDDATEITVATRTQAAAGSSGSVTGTSTGSNQQTAWLVAVLPTADTVAAVSATRSSTATLAAQRSDAAAVTASRASAPTVTAVRSDSAAAAAATGPAGLVTGLRTDTAAVSATRTATAAVTAASSTAAVSASSGPVSSPTATVSSPAQVTATTGAAATVAAVRSDSAQVSATRTAVATVTPVQPTGSVTATTGRAATVTGQRVDVAAVTATRARVATVTGLRTDRGQVLAESGSSAAVSAGSISALGAVGAALNPSVWAVDRVTLQITGQLPAWTRLALSPVENSPGSCELRYPVGQAGFAALFAGVRASPQRDQEIEVWLDGTRASRTRWLLQQKSGDDVALGEVWTFTGHGLAQLLDEIVVGPQTSETRELLFVGATYGTVLITAVQQAQARSAAILAALTWDFTTTHDSNGQPWASTISDLRFAPDDTLLAVAQAGVDYVIGEFEVTADRVLRAFNPGSRGLDRSVGATPLRLQAGVNLDEAARRESSRAGDSATAALGKGADGVYEWAVDATAQAERGRRVEVPVDAGQLTSSGAVLATTALRLSALKVGVSERTHGLVFSAGFPIPLLDFDVSDWALSVTGNAASRQRITQWTATFERGRPPSGTARTNTLIEDQLSRLTRRLNAVQRGGAVVGTSQPPSAEDTVAPAAPTGVTVDSLAYTEGADTYATVIVGWAPVTTNATGPISPKAQAAQLILTRMQSGQPIAEDWTWAGAPQVVGVWNDSLLVDFEASGSGDAQAWLAAFVTANTVAGAAADDVAGYRVQWRPQSESAESWRLGADVSGGASTSASFGGVGAGIDVLVRVAAYDTTGNQSQWSAEVVLLTATDDDAPPTPSTPGAFPYLGQAKITYDGKGSSGEPMPDDTDVVELHKSLASGFTATASTAVDTFTPNILGERVLTDLDYGVTIFVRLVARDRAGNRSAMSAQASVVPSKVVNIDLGPEAVERAAIKLLAVDSAQMNLLAVNDAQFGSGSFGKLTAGVISVAVTNAGIIRTGISGARTEQDAGGFRVYNGSGVQTIALMPAGVSYITGEFRTALSGARFVWNPGGTEPDVLRIYPSSGANFATITADGVSGQAIFKARGNSTRGDQSAGEIGAWPTEAFIAWAVSGTSVPFSRITCRETNNEIVGPNNRLIMEERYPAPAGAGRYTSLYHRTSGGVDIGQSFIHHQRGSDNSAWLHQPVNNSGLIFAPNFMLVSNSAGSAIGITASSFDVVSGQQFKRQIRRPDLGTVDGTPVRARDVTRRVRAQQFEYRSDGDRPATPGLRLRTGVDEDGTETYADAEWSTPPRPARTHIGLIAEDVAAVAPQLVSTDQPDRLKLSVMGVAAMAWDASADNADDIDLLRAELTQIHAQLAALHAGGPP